MATGVTSLNAPFGAWCFLTLLQVLDDGRLSDKS